MTSISSVATGSLTREVGSTAKALLRSDLDGVSFGLLDGKTLRSEDIKGHRVILLFWSLYCTSCFDDLKEFAEMTTRFAGDDISFYAVHLFESRIEKIQNVMRKRGIRLPILTASGEVRNRFAVRMLPTYLVFDEKHKLLGRFEGPSDFTALELFLHGSKSTNERHAGSLHFQGEQE